MAKIMCVTCNILKEADPSEYSKWLNNGNYQFFCADCIKMHKRNKRIKDDKARSRFKTSIYNS